MAQSPTSRNAEDHQAQDQANKYQASDQEPHNAEVAVGGVVEGPIEAAEETPEQSARLPAWA